MATKTPAFSKAEALEAIKQFRTKNVTASSLSRLLPRLAVLLSSEAHPNNLVMLARDLRGTAGARSDLKTWIQRKGPAFCAWIHQKGPGFCVLLDQVLSAGEALEPFSSQIVEVLSELRAVVPDRQNEAIRVRSEKFFNPNPKRKQKRVPKPNPNAKPDPLETDDEQKTLLALTETEKKTVRTLVEIACFTQDAAINHVMKARHKKPAAVKTKPSASDGVDSWDDPADKDEAKDCLTRLSMNLRALEDTHRRTVEYMRTEIRALKTFLDKP